MYTISSQCVLPQPLSVEGQCMLRSLFVLGGLGEGFGQFGCTSCSYMPSPSHASLSFQPEQCIIAAKVRLPGMPLSGVQGRYMWRTHIYYTGLLVVAKMLC